MYDCLITIHFFVCFFFVVLFFSFVSAMSSHNVRVFDWNNVTGNMKATVAEAQFNEFKKHLQKALSEDPLIDLIELHSIEKQTLKFLKSDGYEVFEIDCSHPGICCNIDFNLQSF